MPELQFKGKEFVYNHHLTVPYRPLVMDASKSIGKPNLNGNLIVPQLVWYTIINEFLNAFSRDLKVHQSVERLRDCLCTMSLRSLSYFHSFAQALIYDFLRRDALEGRAYSGVVC